MAVPWVILAPGTADERAIIVDLRLEIGRECAGAEAHRRLIVNDELASRSHAYLTATPNGGLQLVDTSTNGTRVNGVLVERGVPVPLNPMDRVTIGTTVVEVRSSTPPGDADVPLNTTLREIGTSTMAIVVGDIIGFTALSELHGSSAVAAAVDALFASLTPLLAANGGVVGNYLGDAYFAVWEAGTGEQQVERALGFALSAADRATEVAQTLDLRDEHGKPLRMGWAVTLGDATRTAVRAGRPTLHGDAVNLAFRVSGLAGRDGRPPVLADAGIRGAAGPGVVWGDRDEVTVKGRRTPAVVYGVSRP
jgi:class 3 adenylate cyclase